jgi:hypothetical protein
VLKNAEGFAVAAGDRFCALCLLFLLCTILHADGVDGHWGGVFTGVLDGPS